MAIMMGNAFLDNSQGSGCVLTSPLDVKICDARVPIVCIKTGIGMVLCATACDLSVST